MKDGCGQTPGLRKCNGLPEEISLIRPWARKAHSCPEMRGHMNQHKKTAMAKQAIFEWRIRLEIAGKTEACIALEFTGVASLKQ